MSEEFEPLDYYNYKTLPRFLFNLSSILYKGDINDKIRLNFQEFKGCILLQFKSYKNAK